MNARTFALRVIGFSVLAAGMSFGQLGHLGSTVEDAKKTDLFTFFHLKETGRDTMVHYRPSGTDFHDLAEVNLAVAGDSLTGARLSLARSFVSGPNVVFAKDLMVSFLSTALTDRDLGILKPLITQANVPGLGGAPDTFACSTPSSFEAMQDAHLTIRCDPATNLVTFDVHDR